MRTLTERRAEFVYNAARLAAIAAKAPIIPVPWDKREQDFKDQFLKVIERQCGDSRSQSPEELHGSWMQSYFTMGWVYGKEYDREKRIHPDLVPYAELRQLERDKDAVFVALCEIARQWITEEDLEKYDWEHSDIVGYLIPKPSLCDICIYAYYLEGGFVSIGHENYHQRYCDKKTIAIHTEGLNDCEFFKDKNLTK